MVALLTKVTRFDLIDIALTFGSIFGENIVINWLSWFNNRRISINKDQWATDAAR